MPETPTEDQRPSDTEAPARDRSLDYGDGPDPATANATPESPEPDEDIEPEIAADDAGASAAAEMMGKARLREH